MIWTKPPWLCSMLIFRGATWFKAILILGEFPYESPPFGVTTRREQVAINCPERGFAYTFLWKLLKVAPLSFLCVLQVCFFKWTTFQLSDQMHPSTQIFIGKTRDFSTIPFRVSTPLKKYACQNGNLPPIGVKQQMFETFWNHQHPTVSVPPCALESGSLNLKGRAGG